VWVCVRSENMKLKKNVLFTVILIVIAIISSSIPAFAVKSYSSLKKNPEFHYGIDVSKWNGTLDWKALKNQGIEFAYIRVGLYDKQGGHLDSKFKTNIKQCVANGIEFGVYVYTNVYTYAKAKACAKWVSKQLDSMGNYCKDKDTIQVAYDIEDEGFITAIKKKTISKSYLQKSVLKFTNNIKSSGYIPVVYSYETFFKDYLNLTDLQEKGNKIWYARWPKSLDVTKKKLLFNNTYTDVWQYSSSYYINGVNLDTDVCYDDFYDYSNEDSKLTVEGLKDSYAYKESGVKPSISVYSGKTLLQKGTDYTLQYFSNKNPGEGRIKIIRYKNGKYKETKTVKFVIKPSEVENLKYTAKQKSITLSWDRDSSDISYKVYKYDDELEKYVLLNTIEDNSITVENLEKSSSYSFKVASVRTINGKKYTGIKSEITAYTKLSKTALDLVESSADEQAHLEWSNKESSEISGYQINYSTSSDFTNKTTITVDSETNSYTIDNLTSNKNYYFRVRMYKEIDGKKVYGTYSDVSSITVQ
jgi:GH25 family lysozyme M1 (1,4-beta-N-acetylmuramidase)